MVNSRQARIKNSYAENRLFMCGASSPASSRSVLLLASPGGCSISRSSRYEYYSEPLPGQSDPHRAHSAEPRADPRPQRRWCSPTTSRPSTSSWSASRSADMKALDATLAQLVDIGVLRAEEVAAIRRTIHVAQGVRERAHQASDGRGADGAVRRPSLPVLRRGYSPAPRAPLSVEGDGRSRHRLCERHQRRGSEEASTAPNMRAPA